MTPEEWQRIKRIVFEASDRPPSDRAAFIASACAGDGWLQAEVESLARSAAEAADLYETSALTMAGAAEALVETAASGFVAPGDRIGAYRIVRELGRGGMGSVYLAERADGEFDQRVAIKFVGGALNDRLLHRFREERRILAGLQHPHIARLLDGGTTADGRPYVIMEYVDGVPIDEFCDSGRLPLRERLALFRRVCDAVQFAHRHLVIHRDIKAGNILVTSDGTPKLLDFGIATVFQPEPEMMARTTTLRALTPESASPEQVRGEAITIATDVYALGLLLYRLVAGRGPYGDAVASDAALLRAICDEMPPAPGADRDLNLIVLKALRKEPDRRYASAAQLSDDLARYRARLPVMAAPDSARYRAGKFLRRHRVSATAAAVALLAILVGLGVALSQAAVARRERARAEQRLADVRRLANSFVFEFHDAIADLPGSLKARQLVVKRAAEYLDALARESEDDITLQRELATAYQRLGDIVGGPGVSNLGDLKGALEQYQRALRIREGVASRGVREPVDVEGTSEVHVRVSRALAGSMDLEQSETSARSAVLVLRPRPDADVAAPFLGPLATAYQQLGYVQMLAGKDAESLDSLAQALAHGRASVAAAPMEARELTRLARIQADYAELLLRAGRPSEALAIARDAQAHLERLSATDPANQRYPQTLLFVLNAQGQALQALGDSRGAVVVYETAVGTADALRAASPDDQGAVFAVAFNRYALGNALVVSGDAGAGLRPLRQALVDLRDLLQAAPKNDFYRYTLALAGTELGKVLVGEGGGASPCAEIRPALDAWEELRSRNRLPGEATRFQADVVRLQARCRQP